MPDYSESKKGRQVIPMVITACREGRHNECTRFTTGQTMIFFCNCSCHSSVSQLPEFGADFNPPFDNVPSQLNLL